jgi:hypothetical protein
VSFSTVVLLSLACSGVVDTPKPPVDESRPPVAVSAPAESRGGLTFDELLEKDLFRTKSAGFEHVMSVNDGGSCSDVYAVRPEAPQEVVASSILVEGVLRHAPTRAVDGDPSTAWVEGVPGDGIGESITLLFEQGQTPSALLIVPGYAKDAERWQANNRVSAIFVRWLVVPEERAEVASEGTRWSRGDLKYRWDPWEDGFVYQMAREDGSIPMGTPQIIDLGDAWVQNHSYQYAAGIEVRIAEIDDAGAVHDDTAVAELQLLYKTGERLDQRCPGMP